MAMTWTRKKLFVILVVKLVLILHQNGLISKGHTMVAANGNLKIVGPFMQIEKPSFSKLLIKNPHIPHFLPCIPTIEESYEHEGQTDYYHTWFHNGKVLETPVGNRRNEFHIDGNGTLKLPPNERAAGKYQCKVNANTTAVLSDVITVEYPVLKRIPTAANLSASCYSSLTLDCPVLSIPPANITWFFGNESLLKIDENNRFLILGNGSLVITNVLMQDAGKYKCIAHNQFSAKKHRQFTRLLSVNETFTVFSKIGELVPPLQNTTQYIPLGSEFKLLCRCSVDTVPITWWFLRSPFESPIKLFNHTDEYNVDFATVEDHEGYYICATPNTRQTFNVIITIPPTITEPLPSYETLISASITFRCFTSGNPLPSISWHHNGNPVTSSYTRYVHDNELIIHSFDPEEGGIYQCFSRNIAGQTSSAGEVRFKSKDEEMVRRNPWQNIRCFAHSFNTVNVTFESKSTESLVIVHIVQNNPHRWISPPLMKLNHTSYLVISNDLPVYRPFELMMRVLYPTSKISLGNKPQQQTMLSSLRSAPITCCTQGLLLHLVNIDNDTFVTWSQPKLSTKKYFILQYSINFTQPHPQKLRSETLRGTMQDVSLNAGDVTRKLTNIHALNASFVAKILNGIKSKYPKNEVQESYLEPEAEPIFSLVVPANVTGVLMQNFTRLKMRVLIITSENENLAQDLRYVQWKTIENETIEQTTVPFRLKTVESRMLIFNFNKDFQDSCVHVCLWQIQFPVINKEEQKCDQYTINNSQLEMRGLKPTERYRLNFLSCKTQMFYGILDVQTLPDPPGTVSNQRITRQNGLKLSWDPPTQPNGKVHHYNILWTLDNVTHEANVLECSICFFKFPNISERAKINVTVRVVGETGVGAPIFLDLRSISHDTLEIESATFNSDIYSGIAIGSLLSTFCVFCFALLIIFQRKRFKSRQQSPSHLISSSNLNCGHSSNVPFADDSTSALGGITLHHDCHEMQTLIPKNDFITDHVNGQNDFYTTQIPNGNSCKPPEECPRNIDSTVRSNVEEDIEDIMTQSIPSNLSFDPDITNSKVNDNKPIAYFTIKFQQIQLRSNKSLVPQ